MVSAYSNKFAAYTQLAAYLLSGREASFGLKMLGVVTNHTFVTKRELLY